MYRGILLDLETWVWRVFRLLALGVSWHPAAVTVGSRLSFTLLLSTVLFS